MPRRANLGADISPRSRLPHAGIVDSQKPVKVYAVRLESYAVSRKPDWFVGLMFRFFLPLVVRMTKFKFYELSSHSEGVVPLARRIEYIFPRNR